MSSSTTRTHATPLRFRVRAEERSHGEAPKLPWWMLALGAAGLTAVAGWTLATAAVVLGWLAGPTEDFADAIGYGTTVWLLAHGVSEPGWTIIPLTFTAAIIALLGWLSSIAVRGRREEHPPAPHPQAEGPLRSALVVTATITGTYVVVITGIAALVGRPLGAALIGAAVVALIGSGLGAVRALPAAPALLPAPVAALPLATATAVVIPGIVGAALFSWSLFTHRDQVAALVTGLQVGGLASAGLAVAQLAYLVNAVIWATSYALGAGFGLGDASVVAPGGVELGLLPGIPLFGALPTEGMPPIAAAAWFVVAALAGLGAAVVVTGRRPQASLTEAIAVAGTAGLLAGAGWVLLGWSAGGDLGTERLVDLGPRLPQLLAYVPGAMALTAAFFAMMIVGLRARREQQATG
ncbi:DUF6350 family protein [Naumannella halotolerans]|uniref:cell division protein PerM n=1 Tax=Naumannella halotolerans TaxID=993414 RepID=UPI00370D5B81